MSFILPEETQKKFYELGVSTVYLFGSRAQELETPLSDYDFGILLAPGTKRSLELYNQLFAIFDPLCPRGHENDVIDIVFLDDVVSLELRMHIVRYGRVLFDTDSKARVRFEEQTMFRYCDYRPLLDMFDRAILASL